mgnify:CR=1 FL=1
MKPHKEVVRTLLKRPGVKAELAAAESEDEEQAAAEAQAVGLTLVPINNTAETLKHPQFEHRQYYAEVEHPVLGRAIYPTVPYRMTETPAKIGVGFAGVRPSYVEPGVQLEYTPTPNENFARNSGFVIASHSRSGVVLM